MTIMYEVEGKLMKFISLEELAEIKKVIEEHYIHKQTVKDAIDEMIKDWHNDDVAAQFYMEVKRMKQRLGL